MSTVNINIFIELFVKMPVQLYYTIASPPARAVILTLKNLDIPHELHNVNLLKGEHKSEEFLKVKY